jgi:hypothetical protein
VNQSLVGPRPTFMANNLSAGTAANHQQQPQLQAPDKKTKEPSLLERSLDQYWIEYYGEMGRIAARRAVDPSPTNTPFSYSAVFAGMSPISDNFTSYGYEYYDETDNRRRRLYTNNNEELFGITAFRCETCNNIHSQMTFFSPGDKGIWCYVIPYQCYRILNGALLNNEVTSTTSDIDSNPVQETRDKGEKEKEKAAANINIDYSLFEEHLKKSISEWMEKRNPKLLAVEVIDPTRCENNLVPFVLTNLATGQKYSGKVQYSDDKCIKLDPAKTGSWALRAIKDKCASVSEDEISNFLNKTKTSTFGFFKIEDKTGIHIYLMALAKGEEKSNEADNTSTNTTTAAKDGKGSSNSTSSSTSTKNMSLEILPDLEPIVLPEKSEMNTKEQGSNTDVLKNTTTVKEGNNNNNQHADGKGGTYDNNTAATSSDTTVASLSSFTTSKNVKHRSTQRQQSTIQELIDAYNNRHQKKISDGSSSNAKTVKT